MKLRNIFTMLAAALTFTFVGCEQQEQFLDEVKVSKSYISLPKDGGEVKIEVDAAADWSIVAWDADSSKVVEVPEWLTIEPASGAKGKSEVVFSAEATTETREVMLHLNCGAVYQVLNVAQITQKPEPTLQTCDWINNNAQVDVFYRVKGTVVAFRDFAKYGSFEVNDGTTETNVYIYGSNANTVAPDLAIGDVVTFEGSWSKYNNFNNDTQILSVEKNLIKVEMVSPAELQAEGDVFTVTLTNKGEGFEVLIPEADTTWLSAGEPLVLGTTYVVEITAKENTDVPRTSTVSFTTVSGGKTYTATAQISQKGGIPLVSVAEAIAMPKDSWVMVAGVVSGVHKKGVVVTDAAGDAIYAYVNKTEEELGAALGDEVTVIGQMGDYANFYQIVNPEIKVVSNGKKPVYPTPVVLETAASFETYKTGKFSSIYVEATGFTTGQYGDIKIGDWTVSPYQTSASINIADFKDKEVVVKGYILQYKADNILRVMLTSVKEANAALPTIAQVRAATAGDEVETVGTVVATHQRGYIISDATGSIYVYTSAAPTVKIGNKVTLSGTFDNYYGTLQIKNATVSANDNGTTATYPTPVDLTNQTAYDAYATYSKENPTDFAYVKIKAVLSGGRYLTIGESTKQSQLDWSNGDYSALNDKTVIVTAYMKGFHSNGYYQLIETSVVEAE